MATHATSKSVICAETEVQMHRIIYHWDIKNFDRICTPENEEFEPISSNPFKAGGEIGRESEWELILSAESGYLQIWLYLKKIFTELIKEISVHLTVMIMKDDGTTLLRRRCDKNQIFTPEDNGWGMGYIITIETLWDEREVYLADNTLRLRIQLDILGDLVSRYKRPSIANRSGSNKRRRGDTDTMDYEDDPSTALLKKDFRRLLKSHNGADFTIECEGKSFPVHKAILTARSKVFEAMLKHDTIENRSKIVKINDMTAAAVIGMLDYIYTGDIRHASDMDYLINLVEASDKYELTDLKNQCFRRLCEKINNENIGRIAIIAYMHNAEVEVLQEIRTYCQSNWDTLMKISTFKECVIATPRAFFEDIKGEPHHVSSCDEGK
ncbi:unnamed protein product [Orchesella dallaii]|uniref:Speckle-type POZ protein n=1 Tax=Orchesella dallaii TaxID=48710 RepID=A0ABP1RDI4_9HEXA